MKTTIENINQQVQENVNEDRLVQFDKQDMKNLLTEYVEMKKSDINSWRKESELKRISQEITEKNHQLEARIRVVQRAWVRAFKRIGNGEISNTIILCEWTK